MTTDDLLDRALELTKFQAAHIQRLEAELFALRPTREASPADHVDGRVLELLAEGPLRARDLTAALGADRPVVNRSLHRLSHAGRIAVHGQRRAARWSLVGQSTDRAPATDPEEDRRDSTTDDARDAPGATVGALESLDGGR